MASENKKNKAFNSYVLRNKSLKEKNKVMKRIYFFNASIRKQLKNETREFILRMEY